MAEGNATIAALRAASSAAPTGPSGPVALAYPWMTRQGSELVMPSRAPVARQSRPALPTAPTVVPAREFRKSTVPPEFRVGIAPGAAPPRSIDGSFVTQNTPGFVDGVTLPREPAWNFNPTLLDDLMPRNPDAPVYTMPPREVVPAEPDAAPESSPVFSLPVSSSQMAAEPSVPDLSFFDFTQLEQMPQAVAVESDDPAPYMPGIREREAAPEAAAPAARKADEAVQPQMSVIEMLQQMVPPTVAPAETVESPAPSARGPVSDFGLLEYIQPVPYAEVAPEAAPQTAPVAEPMQAPVPQAVDVTFDPAFLRFLMLQQDEAFL